MVTGGCFIIWVLISLLSFGYQEKIFLFEFGEFLNPRGISVSPSGEIYVADTGNNSVKKFTEDGRFIIDITGYGWGELEFDEPYDVDASSEVSIYVADYNNHRIQRFDRNLNFIATLMTRESPDEASRFGFPRGVAVSKFGDLFIVDGENDRCIKLNKFDQFERNFGGVEAGGGKLTKPSQIAVSMGNLIFVLDVKEVFVFDYYGNFMFKFGAELLNKPTGIFAWDKFLLVADGRSVIWFNHDGKFKFKLDFDEEIRDIAVFNSKIYCLTDSNVRVYKLTFIKDGRKD
jgi:DNA-binding beta-propeller fold protein YncE